ncbi:hypothetical protein ACH4UR_28760 [Streptomyces lydicus]|uniref:hypothetical protein n=1 Tax=Streptomyces lydicus TaxID=47763 RepID=UPI0033E76A69
MTTIQNASASFGFRPCRCSRRSAMDRLLAFASIGVMESGVQPEGAARSPFQQCTIGGDGPVEDGGFGGLGEQESDLGGDLDPGRLHERLA